MRLYEARLNVRFHLRLTAPFVVAEAAAADV